MYPSNGNNDEELSHIQKQINERTNQSLDSTRRMLDLVAESQDVGINTMVALDEQGEKLRKIEDGLDGIHVGVTDAEKNLSELQKCCGLCILPWNRVRRTHRPFNNSSTSVSTDKSSSPRTTEPKLRMAEPEGMPSNGYITRITNDDREQEMDDNLQLVGSYLGNLKNMALDMGDTLADQNQQIGRITDKADSANIRINNANKRTEQLIRRA